MQKNFKKLLHSPKFHCKPVTNLELNLKSTLINGQCFVWQPLPNHDFKLFSGVFQNSHLFLSENSQGEIEYSEFPSNPTINADLNDYFHLDVEMAPLISFWNEQDPHFKEISDKIKGLRIIRQDPLSCLISFLCSQNNNISRITQMISSLTKNFGSFICELENSKFYAFPSLSQLSLIKEEELKAMGFGYRANYIVNTMRQINEKGGVEWLNNLRGKDKEVIRKELMDLKGVGRKVADCVALFSMDCEKCIPVDTHIWQIYQKTYKKDKKEIKMNKENYEVIAGFFEEKFKKYQGWAHSLIFTADLSEFSKEKPQKKVKKEKNLDIELLESILIDFFEFFY